MTNIVLLVGNPNWRNTKSGLRTEKSLLQELFETSSSPINLSIVSIGPGDDIDGVKETLQIDPQLLPKFDRFLRSIGVGQLYSLLDRSPIGRLVNSVGPLDPGRAFWRQVKTDKRIAELLKKSDIVVAADMTSIKTAWIAMKKGWLENAYYDHNATGVGVNFSIPN